MLHKAKKMSNIKKCINESQSFNSNKDFYVNQLKTTSVSWVTLVSITPVDFDSENLWIETFYASKVYNCATIKSNISSEILISY